MKLRIIVSILIIAIFSSCVSQSVPRKEKRAKKKLAKHLNAVEKITNVYPDLKDTFIVTIPEHRVDTIIQVKTDTAYIDTLLEEYVGLSRALKTAKLKRASADEATKRVMKGRIAALTQALDRKRTEIIKKIQVDTSFTYEDKKVIIDISIKDGEIRPVVTVKQQQYNGISYDCSTHFYQDFKFWILLILIIAGIILYRNVKH